MKENIVSTLFTLLILSMHQIAIAQEFMYQHFGVNEGLPSSQVYDIYQDADGYIWFATDRGLSRYNGYEFENFTIKDGLTSNVVLKFFPQKDRVWCYSIYPQSLFYFDKDSESFTPYKYNDVLKKELGRESLVKSLVVDSENGLHMGGHKIFGALIINENGEASKSLETEFRFDKNKRILHFLEDYHDQHFFFQNYFSPGVNVKPSIEYNVYNNIDVKLMSNKRDVVFIDAEKISIVNKHTFKERRINTEKGALIIGYIGTDKFLVGFADGGAKIFNTNGDLIQSFLDDKSVSNFLIDHEGGYWFSTVHSGVYYIKNPKIEIINQFEGNGNNFVNSLTKNNKEELYLGFNNGDIWKKDGQDFQVLHLAKMPNPALVESNMFTDTVLLYSDNHIRIGNIHNETRYSTKISEMDKIGYIGSGPNQFFEILRSGEVKCVEYPVMRVRDACYLNGYIFLATNEGIIKKTDSGYISLKEKSPLLSFRTEDIDVSNNTLYLATLGAGLVIYGDTLFNISTKDGLYSDIVNEVHFENDSTLWLCTNKGLNRIIFGSRNNFSISGISFKDGLISNETEDIEIIGDTIWLATKKGLCIFPKSCIDNRKLENGFLGIVEVVVNGADHSWETDQRLKYNENKITFFMQGISYNKSNELVYQYRLNGHDSLWNNTKSRKIDYSSLRPKSYTFEVKLCVENGSCYNKLEQYSFTILPPFWLTWWFKLFGVFLIGGLIYFFFKIRIFTYNKDITRELLRLLVKKIRKNDSYLIIRESGKDIRLNTQSIVYIQSSGNYIDIITENGNYTIREKLKSFLDLVPDPLEFIRIHRSCIVRIDKVIAKSKNEVEVKGATLPVSKKYHPELKKILIR